MSTIASLLTACGNGGFPSSAIVEQAIAQQVVQIQAPLSRHLKLPAPSAKDIRISHVDIQTRETTVINRNPAYHLSGTYDLSLKQQDQQTQQRGDRFDLYLQAKTDGKVTQWQVAQSDGQGWQLQPLPPAT